MKHSKTAAALITGLALLRGMMCSMALAAEQSDTARSFEDVVFTTGTTTRDQAGRDWAYIIWQADRPERLSNGSIAIYAKTGDAGSTEPYTRRAVVTMQTDVKSIQGLLGVAGKLGENETELASQLDSLFQSRLTGSGFSLAEKLSAALRASKDPETTDNLEFLARTHPVVGMALGRAYSMPMGSAKMTFEVRRWNSELNVDLAVIGRITLTAGTPEILPPPGPPVQVPDPTPQGHLNARFRWGTPGLLNRFSLLQHGFNLYRLPAPFAEQQQFHLQPPPPQLFAQLVASGQAARVNRLPVLPDEEFSHEEAANLIAAQGGDAETYFITDNNRRFEPGGSPFKNGDRFYYYVTARDILGRDGFSSLPTLVTICDRLPPPLPRDIRAGHKYVFENGIGTQFIELTWQPVRDADTGTNIAYRIYRWETPEQYQRLARFPDTNLVGTISPDRSCLDCTMRFHDRGANAPKISGKTYWYTIRVEDHAACGTNISAHAGPVPIALRDFQPPPTPTGQVWIHCGGPVIAYKNNVTIVAPENQALNPATAQLNLHCAQEDTRVEWVDWFVSFGGTAREFLGRQYFNPGVSNVSFQYQISRQDTSKLLSQKFHVQAGSKDGKVSGFAECQLQGAPKSNESRHVYFTADYQTRRVVAGSGDCQHDPAPGLISTAPWTPIEAQFLVPGNANRGIIEWKLYRQVDDEPMSLLAQGTNSGLNAIPVVFQDMALPVNDATVCYFLSYVNEQANVSALHRLACVPVKGTTPLPVPQLAQIEPAGTAASPRMRLRWFCPPYGMERFELSVESTSPITNFLGAQLSTNLVPVSTGSQMRNGLFRTGRVGGDFAPGPVYVIEVPIELGANYRVAIRSVSTGDRVGAYSNTEEFTWENSGSAGINTPWPARPLPPVNRNFNAEISDLPFGGGVPPLGVAAVLLPATNGFSPVGIRIGEVLRVNVSSKGENYLPADVDPLTYVYQTRSGVHLCPFVLYRMQVPNSRHPRVSGDLIQVSPMLDRIAYQRGNYNGVDVSFLRDPYMAVLPSATEPGRPQLVLRDTQPVIAGARYQYLLMHFGPNGEPDMVIPTNPIELPSREPAL